MRTEEKRYSKETEEMLRSGRGYNCESYGEFYGPQPFKKVLEHEVEDMYNVHILEETCRELGIKCRGLEDPANVRMCMEAAEREIERRFGADSKAIWLGTRYDVRTRYCTPGEKPVQYAIPKGAMVMSDLGPDGTLFLFPRGKGLDRDLLRRAGYGVGSPPIPVTRIHRDCGPDVLHPDLVEYIPGVPPRSERCCYNEIGIAGKDVGEPKWGFVASMSYEYYEDVGVGYISRIHVWEEFRRRGYASRMVEYALDDMRTHGIKRVYTATVRPASVELFESLGFSRFGETPLYYAEL